MDNILNMTRNFILFVGWPVLIAGSIYLAIKGKSVYQMVKGSLVGKVTKVLVISMFVEMYSLGLVSTVLMYCDLRGVYLVVPVFIIWFALFIWTLKVLAKSAKEAKKMSEPQPEEPAETKIEN